MFRAASFLLFDALGGLSIALLLLLALACASPERRAQRSVAPLNQGRPSAPTVQPIDPADFGADGADDEDDTAAIQAAIGAAASRLRGRSVALRPGIYYVSDQPPYDQVCLNLERLQRLTLIGSGAAVTRLVLRSAVDAHVVSIADANGVEVRGLSIDGTRSGRKGTHGIRVADSSQVILRELDIRSTAHYGIGLQDGVLRGIRVVGVRISDTGGDGIDFKNTDGKNAELELHDVVVSQPGQTAPRQTGIDIRGPARLWSIQVTGVPKGATGIRFREDGADTGLGGHDSSLTDFRVAGAPGSTGVAIAADRVHVSRGHIAGTDTGLVILGRQAQVSLVEVSGARYAFRIASQAREATLSGCRGEASNAGLWFEGQTARIHESSFTGNRRCGICLRPGAIGAVLVHVQFAGNAIDVDDQSGSQVPP